MAVTVVADSICSPSSEKVKELGIKIVPINIHFGNKIYLDLLEIQPDDFYRRLPSAEELPTTSAPSMERFKVTYEKILDAGHSVFCLTVTSALSLTHNSMTQARDEFPDYLANKICIMDSEAAGASAGLMVIEAAKLARQGLSNEAIEVKIKELIPNCKLVVMFDTLEYIRKSGRVGKVAAVAGELFQVKPVIYLHRGKPQFFGRPRGKRQAIAMIMDQFVRDIAGAKDLRVAVTHANVEEEALALAEEVEAAYPGLEIDIVPFTPAMGAHAGPGVIGIGYTFRSS